MQDTKKPVMATKKLFAARQNKNVELKGYSKDLE